MPYNIRLWFATQLVLATRESADVTTEVLANFMLEDSRSPTALSPQRRNPAKHPEEGNPDLPAHLPPLHRQGPGLSTLSQIC